MRRIALVGLVAIAPMLARAQQPGARRYRETVLPLPAPTGVAALGTTVVYLTDSTRRDSVFTAGRPVTVQLWYPAARAAGPRAPYLFEPGLGALLLRIDYYGIDSSALRSWATMRTHARVDAPAESARHPLVVVSVGQGVIRANYTSIAEELASHGYVVAIVDSPWQGTMLLPDGRMVADTAGALESPAALRIAVAGWSSDISFVLDRLEQRRLPAAASAVAATIDWKKVGALGHSIGGLVAIGACQRDRRVRACANLDGGVASPDREPLADFVSTGITGPVLLLRSQPLYSDTDFARRGLTRAEWEKRGEGGRIALDSLIGRSRGPLWTARIAGTGHLSFSDAPFVMSSAITRFGGRVIEPKRGLYVLTATLRTFFDQYFNGWPDSLGYTASHLPELEATRVK